MTIASRPATFLSKGAYDALIDQLRSCHSSDEILEFEAIFNERDPSIPLHTVICELLRSRSISRVLAAKWLNILIDNRDQKYLDLKNNP